ncbi:MAG: DNA phosphorothioation system sulfurtransferase DndC [Candidatus Promineifilaceae bacterium]
MSRPGLPAENRSIFDEVSIQDIYAEIQKVYLDTALPWVIGYSGGKDSTATAQVVWLALSKLEPEQLQWPIYIIASDTLVETPVIVDHLHTTLRKINESAESQSLPITAHKVIPKTTDTFWVNLIGRGYPAPTQKFRWCTERMKIKPANQFILDRASEFGQVVMVLGSRRSESASRSQIIAREEAKRSVTGTQLRYHHNLRSALVYTPIQEWTTDDVWQYLLQVKSPWGSKNRDLLTMYRAANSGECPLVIDDTTPSCGNSRFGCWTCTVVTRDKSMEAMIDNGEEWMEPLLEFRDWLSETQVPAVKHLFREHKRRTGHVLIEAKGHDGSRLRGLRQIDEFLSQDGHAVQDGKLIRGPYKFSFCKEMLQRLLKTQNDIRRDGPNPNQELITEAELHEIRRLWRTERQDWEDSVPLIYQECTGQALDWLQDDVGAFSAQEYRVLSELCDSAEIPTNLVAKLLEQERQMQGMHRRAGIFNRLDEVLREDWRDEATIRATYSLPMLDESDGMRP